MFPILCCWRQRKGYRRGTAVTGYGCPVSCLCEVLIAVGALIQCTSVLPVQLLFFLACAASTEGSVETAALVGCDCSHKGVQQHCHLPTKRVFLLQQIWVLCITLKGPNGLLCCAG